MLTLIKSPFIEFKLTILRNKKTSNTLFRQTMNEVSYLIAADVLQHLKYKKINIQTPLVKTTGLSISSIPIIVPILRAGIRFGGRICKIFTRCRKRPYRFVS